MDYFAFVKLMLGSRFICTDGGSNQEEAAMLGLPTLILRKNTERQDGLDDTAVLSGLEDKIIDDFIRKHINHDWVIKEINESRPSSIIVDRLARI
jgi:UDP-N-acetylglucosamine 2-epimerase (non-hydrolysing)